MAIRKVDIQKEIEDKLKQDLTESELCIIDNREKVIDAMIKSLMYEEKPIDLNAKMFDFKDSFKMVSFAAKCTHILVQRYIDAGWNVNYQAGRNGGGLYYFDANKEYDDGKSGM
jgi:hypothetical protein